jgi:hypothetical protein
MTGWPHVFASEAGDVSASQLDDNFNAAAFASDLAALDVTVSNLPATTTPLAPAAVGAVGSSGTLARADHVHPVQGSTPNAQTSTSYTVQLSDNGGVVTLSNASAVTVTVPATLPATFSCICVQYGAGQVGFVAGSGAAQRQRSGNSHAAGQYAPVTILGLTNVGGSAFEYVLSGDMA